MNLARRVERAEAATGANACPCRSPVRIEIVEGSKSDALEDAGPCGACGSPLPVRVIEAMGPEKGRP